MSPHFARVVKEVYGYKNVKYMVAGHGTWQEGINPYYTEPEFLKMAQDEGMSYTLVDLRSPAKAKREHIRGAISFPLGGDSLTAMSDLDDALPRKHKKKARIIYYSDNPEEAVLAHKIMRINGWENGYILNGGIAAWKVKGYPVESGPLSTGISYKKTSLPDAMSIPDYEKIVLHRPANTVIVDVRSPGEYMKSMVPGAMTIPIDTLDKRFSEIPRDKRIITQCAAGNRALMAYRILKDHGYQNVRWVNGKIAKFSKGILKTGAYGK